MNKAIKYTYITISINLCIAIVMAIMLNNGSKYPLKSFIDFILSFPLAFSLVIISLYVSGHYIAKKMQHLICIKKWYAIPVGIFGLLVILICGIIGGSTVGFIEEGLLQGKAIGGALFDYYVKPLFWVLLFGLIPTLISGIFLGIRIEIAGCTGTNTKNSFQ